MACKILSCPVHGVPCKSVDISDCARLKQLDAQIDELLDQQAKPRLFVEAPPHLQRSDDDAN